VKRREAITILTEILERDLTIDVGSCEYMSLIKLATANSRPEAFEIHFKAPLDPSSKLFLRDFAENHGLSVEEENGLIVICEPQLMP